MKKEHINAYDFDGVFVPDLDIDYTDETFMSVWAKIRPLFVPKDPIIILTMRNSAVMDFTTKYMVKHKFNVREAHFLAGDMSHMSLEEVGCYFSPLNSARKKFEALIEISHRYNIDAYYESDPIVVSNMRNMLHSSSINVPIIHFSTAVISMLASPITK